MVYLVSSCWSLALRGPRSAVPRVLACDRDHTLSPTPNTAVTFACAPPRRLDGSTNRIQRMIDMEQFNKPGSDIFIYILCTRAGGLGVNLQVTGVGRRGTKVWCGGRGGCAF